MSCYMQPVAAKRHHKHHHRLGDANDIFNTAQGILNAAGQGVSTYNQIAGGGGGSQVPYGPAQEQAAGGGVNNAGVKGNVSFDTGTPTDSGTSSSGSFFSSIPIWGWGIGAFLAYKLLEK